MQFTAEAIANQPKASRERLSSRTITDYHNLGRLRAPFDDHLKIAGEATMGCVRVAWQARVNDRAAYGLRDPVDQRMLDAAVGDVDYPMSANCE